MALNLLNDKSFNDYLTDITYAGESVPKQQNFRGEFESPDYVYQHRDEIVKGILNQYIKLRVREYILNLENRLSPRAFSSFFFLFRFFLLNTIN